SHDARMHATGAGGAIAAAADNPAVGLDVHFEEGGVVSAGEVSERLAALGTALLVGRQSQEFLGGRQLTVVAAAVSGVTALLSAGRSAAVLGRGRVGVGGRRVAVRAGSRGRGQLVGAWSCLGATAEVLLAQEAQLRFEFGDT